MKKKLLTTLSAMALLGLVGCGTKDIENNDSSNQMISSTGGGEGSAQSIDGPGLTDEEFATMKQTYGKITSVIGNEIEVSIANNPFLNSEEGEEELPEGGMVAMETTDSIAAAPAGEGEISGDILMNENKLELEYTGETESYTIPTGTIIFSMNGQGTINDLKEGSVVSISIVGDEGAEKVYSIDILE